MNDFGRGYATCLVQFANHRARLKGDADLYGKMADEYPDDGLFRDRGAGLWASGSSDHLYELVRPKKGLSAADWHDARSMADRALDIGHGYRPSSKSNPEECVGLLDEADRLLASIAVSELDAAMEWDRAHGLSPDKGEWSCAEDLRR